jgi:hypothetical protein
MSRRNESNDSTDDEYFDEDDYEMECSSSSLSDDGNEDLATSISSLENSNQMGSTEEVREESQALEKSNTPSNSIV